MWSLRDEFQQLSKLAQKKTSKGFDFRNFLETLPEATEAMSEVLLINMEESISRLVFDLLYGVDI